MEDEEGAIIFLNQRKMFDRAEWGGYICALNNLVLVTVSGAGYKCI
jgi:hypothetical protein